MKVILVSLNAYGEKLAIPFNEAALDAIMESKVVNAEYESKINGYKNYITNRKLDVSIVNSTSLEKAPVSLSDEIKEMEEKHEKLLALANELQQQIDAKRSN